jgi:hypothetical protein
MFGTKEDSRGNIQMINNQGSATTTMDADNAIWSAAAALKTAPWGSRKLYTRLPNTDDPLSPAAPIAPAVFTDVGSGFDALKAHVNATNETNKKRAVQFAAGGDTLLGKIEGDRPVSNRQTIMGDVINSAPTTVEYAWGGVVKDKLGDANGRQFRLILVGTNQGWLHAFGEEATTNSQGRVSATVKELWAFMPTDFLANLDYITKGGNPHRSMVDGTPAIYHLDIPSRTEGIGNGIVDPGERVLAIFGLGKGGRSYYAINIEDPFNPKIQWTLIPDEAARIPSGRIEKGSSAKLADVHRMVGSFGFSTATPAFGRVVYNDGEGSQLKDAVFLGGGFSVPEVDKKFGETAKLGRSIIALDAYSGKILAAEDLGAKHPDMGPIGTGLIPFEFIINSGAAQRAYFTDYNGGLWAWGSTEVVETQSDIYHDYRKDTSLINDWKVRKIYQDGNPAAVRSNRYTTPPAPFLVGSFTGKGKDGSPRPATVGIAMVSGDRNNPLDYFYEDANKPVNHKLTVLFDRQDSKAWDNAGGVINGTITETALANFTNNAVTGTPADYCGDAIFKYITPYCDDYYLAPKYGNPKFGYHIDFPGAQGKFFPKGITAPIVVSGSLFYTVFSPESADPCLGGVGLSRSWVVADVLNPLSQDNRDSDKDKDGYKEFRSGMVNTWGGVASNYIQVGTRGVLQGGTPANAETATLEIRPSASSPSQGFPRPRVWRVVK